MEAYFGKPTKALKCKPPAACLAADVFVLVEGAAVAFHRGTRQKRRAMCGLLIFKPPVCQVSAVGMRPRTHTQKPLSHNPSLSLSLSLSRVASCQLRGHTSCGVVISLFMNCLEIELRTAFGSNQRIHGWRCSFVQIANASLTLLETFSTRLLLNMLII